MYELGGEVFVRALREPMERDGKEFVSIVHEDHDPAGLISRLPIGWEGEVRIKREYDEEVDFRQVSD